MHVGHACQTKYYCPYCHACLLAAASSSDHIYSLLHRICKPVCYFFVFYRACIHIHCTHAFHFLSATASASASACRHKMLTISRYKLHASTRARSTPSVSKNIYYTGSKNEPRKYWTVVIQIISAYESLVKYYISSTHIHVSSNTTSKEDSLT